MEKTQICPLPPMGWNSWNTFYDQINENLIRETADAIAATGLREAGYEYLIIDDCWSLKERDENGYLVPDPEKFPSGIKAAADYVHSKGLKFGIYSCCGTRTCADYPGSFEHEFQDAQQFSDWGVDYLKYDNCNRPVVQSTPMLYRRMSMALRQTGRDIVLAACQWGTEDVHHWIRSSGAHTFRSTVDIQDTWSSIEDIAESQMALQSFSGPDCFNDMDMLVVGMHGGGFNPETNMGGCTDEEYQTHFALWALMNSPLIIGCDIRHMSDKTGEILMNEDLIAINQDPECRSSYRVDVYGFPGCFSLIKPLSDGAYAVGLFNFSDVANNVTLNFWDMGLSAAAGYGMELYDCISHQKEGVKKEYIRYKIPTHGCRVFRMKPCRV